MSDDQSGRQRDDDPGAADPRTAVDHETGKPFEPPPFEPRPFALPERDTPSEWSSSQPGSPTSAEPQPRTPPPPSTPPPAAPARDPNVDAIARAGLAPDVDGWLREVAGQVDPRLDRVAPGWRGREQAGVARACVFGLMLGRLANDYPHTSGDLGRVAEAHPSFATLPAGARLATLRELAHDRSRGSQWVAGLVGLEHDPSRLHDILD